MTDVVARSSGRETVGGGGGALARWTLCLSVVILAR